MRFVLSGLLIKDGIFLNDLLAHPRDHHLISIKLTVQIKNSSIWVLTTKIKNDKINYINKSILPLGTLLLKNGQFFKAKYNCQGP